MKALICAMLLIFVGCGQDTHQPQLFSFKQNVIVKSDFYKGMEGKIIGTWECVTDFTVIGPRHFQPVYRVLMFDNVLKDNLSFKQDDLEASKE